MDETTDMSILSQPNAMQALLDLLRSEIMVQGWTFSLYRSQKGRCWACYKTFEPIMVNTSVELDTADGDTALVWAMLLAMHSHVYKLDTGDIHTEKWMPKPHAPERKVLALRWLLEQMALVEQHYTSPPTERQGNPKRTK